MKYSVKILLFSSLFAIVTSVFSGCGNEESSETIPQGRITYQITYPYFNQNSLMASLLPKEMIMTYKGSKMKIEVNMKKLFSNVIISDEKTRSITLLLKLSSRQIAANLNEGEIQRFLADFPDVEYLQSTKNREYGNKTGKHTVAVFTDISREIDVYFSDEFGLENPNWCTPFNEVKGVLLQYDMARYGLTMRFTAVKIEEIPISESAFSIPEGYEKTPFDEIEKELKDMFSQVQDNL